MILQICDYIFVTVGTPQNVDGAIELSIIKKAVSVIGKNLQNNNNNPTIFINSTVVPGTSNEAGCGCS